VNLEKLKQKRESAKSRAEALEKEKTKDGRLPAHGQEGGWVIPRGELPM